MQNFLRTCMVLMIITGTISVITISNINFLDSEANALLLSDRRHVNLVADAPIAISEDNVYVAWWTNKSGNNEILFRASNDNGDYIWRKD